jgi:hypothetical protein
MWLPSENPRLRRPGLAGIVACLALSGASIGAPAASAGSSYPAALSRPISRQARAPARTARAAHPRPHPRPKRKKPPKPKLHGDPARALLVFQAMQKYYYIAGSSLYSGEPFSYLWPFSQALAATVSMANIPSISRIPSVSRALAAEVHDRLIGLRNYLDTSNSGEPNGIFTSNLAAFDGTVAPPTGPGGAKYYDDNDWVGIELVRLYETTHNAALLGTAEGVMAFEMAGWQATQELACPGGIPFSNTSENTDRNTVTNAPAAELAAQLYRITRNAQYLQFAETAYQWVRACLLLPGGLYADHIRQHGEVEPTVWSYNQGTMIGAGTLLYQATGNSGYLYDARQTAQAALAYLTPARLGSEIPFFPSVYFRNLLYLDSVTHDPPGPKLAQAYVDYAWQHLRRSNGLFVAGSPPSPQLLVQAAIVQIYALLSSPPGSYF